MAQIIIATWNVNSIRARLQAVLTWLERHRPHVLCLQETKVQDPEFPEEAFRQIGYEVGFTGQKAYNGVALAARLPLTDLSFDFPEDPNPSQKRFIAATAGGLRLMNVYIPNGSEVGSPQFAYKLDFLAQLHRYLKEHHDPQAPLLITGDFNVAPEAFDVYDPEAMEGEILFHPQERLALAEIKRWGLTDVFRLHHREGGHFTWWDYRMNAFRRKMGLRIDHIWATSALAKRCTGCEIDREPRTQTKPSDHTPVIATFEDLRS